jgi:hypothetical protein
MSGDRSSKWEAFQVPVHGRKRIAIRFSWTDGRRVSNDVGLVLLRLVQPDPSVALGAYLVNGTEGVRLPYLRDIGYPIPPEALHNASLYLLYEESADLEEAVRTVAEWIPVQTEEQAENYRSKIALADAWPKPPEDREEEVATLRRLAGTGGTRSERKAYRRSALRCLAVLEHSRVLDIQAQLKEPSALETLEADMQPLVAALVVFRLAGQASNGNVAAVTKGILDLPRALQTNPDVRVLLDLARENRTNPEAARRAQIQRMKETLSLGRYGECIKEGSELAREEDVETELLQIYVQAVVGQLDELLHAGDAPSVEELLEREERILENALGSEHGWLASVRSWLEGQGAAFDVEGPPFAEILPEDGEDFSLTLWGKMRTWLSK